MRYMLLGPREQQGLLLSLQQMPRYLEQVFAHLDAELARRRTSAAFSPVEQVWHLADLEEEFSTRIERLLHSDGVFLPDFDGAARAAERNYRALRLEGGLVAFAAARGKNVERLRSVSPEQWQRRGTQEGIGPVSLCDIPVFMAEHDDAHRREIEQWKRENG